MCRYCTHELRPLAQRLVGALSGEGERIAKGFAVRALVVEGARPRMTGNEHTQLVSDSTTKVEGLFDELEYERRRRVAPFERNHHLHRVYNEVQNLVTDGMAVSRERDGRHPRVTIARGASPELARRLGLGDVWDEVALSSATVNGDPTARILGGTIVTTGGRVGSADAARRLAAELVELADELDRGAGRS